MEMPHTDFIYFLKLLSQNLDYGISSDIVMKNNYCPYEF